jgi:dihydrofolate reductase
MGQIHIDLFTTLDGVAQAPGAPQEDPEGGFRFGGWQAPLFDDEVGEQVAAGMERLDALLLGRKTYDIFAAHWPHREGGTDSDIATLFNRIPKYVASRGNPELSWHDSTLLGPDLASAVHEIRARHEEVHVIGSLDLVQTLFAERLFDRLNLWVHPIVLGPGKKVFADGAVPASLRLLEPARTSSKGAVQLRYALVEGTPGTGDMAADDRD